MLPPRSRNSKFSVLLLPKSNISTFLYHLYYSNHFSRFTYHSPPTITMSSPFLLQFTLILSSILLTSSCPDRCGNTIIPFPFHLTSSCGLPTYVPYFHLTCDPHNSTLLLSLSSSSPPLHVLSFHPSSFSLLLSSSSLSSSSCSNNRWYSSLIPKLFSLSPYLSLSSTNILRLYDCDDSSICKPGCESLDLGPHCNGSAINRGCCYPLADGSVWKVGDGFDVFKDFGCRSFSSWAHRNSDSGFETGIEMEWAVPAGNGTECATGAQMVNATGVRGGVRCACSPGFVGDGFAAGSGCYKSHSSCTTDASNITKDADCCDGHFCRKKLLLLVAMLASVLFVAAATACYFLLRNSPPKQRYKSDPNQKCLPKFFGQACRTRRFSYQELNEATKGFNQDQKLIDSSSNTDSIHQGILHDRSLVAVQRISCGSHHNLKQLLEKVEFVSQISHKNIARVIGCCVSSGHSLLLVHEFFPNGTLKELLQPGTENGALGWYRRINIATEIASALSHLQSNISPPLRPSNIKSSDIFILPDYSVKVASYKLICSSNEDVVHNFGLLLMDLILGVQKFEGNEELVVKEIQERRLNDLVDPMLQFKEQLPTQCEQIENLANFALHCLSRRGLCMVEAAKEFIRIVNDNIDGKSSYEPALEVTFSNSSLLQMISISPDTLHVPKY